MTINNNTQHTVILLGVDQQQQKQTLRANLPSLLATEIPFERFILSASSKNTLSLALAAVSVAYASCFVAYERGHFSVPICMNTKQLAYEQHRQDKAKEVTLLAPVWVFVSAEKAAECGINGLHDTRAERLLNHAANTTKDLRFNNQSVLLHSSSLYTIIV